MSRNYLSEAGKSGRLSYMSEETRDFCRKVAVLVFPMALQNLINTGIASIDVIMLGRVGEKVLSGASLGAQVAFVMNLIVFGFCSGASVLIAQYWGKRDMRAIETVFGMSAKLTVLLALAFMLAALFIPNLLMRLFTNDPEVIRQGIAYLRVVGLSYPLNALAMIYLNSMRNLGQVRVATVAYFCSLVTNVVVNSLFIFGLAGFPALGITGAAIGTVCARAMEVLIVLLYDRKVNPHFRMKLEFFFRRDPLLSKDFWTFTAPVVANELMWGLGMSTMAAIMGHLGSEVIAANSVAQVSRNLATVLGFGVASAAAIMTGNVIGQGDRDLARRNGRRFMILSVLTGLLGAGIILAVRPILLATMVLTEGAARNLSFMLLVMAVYVIFQSVNTTAVVGIFRGGGDTRFGFFLDVGFMWGVGILGGFLSAFVFHAPTFIVILFLLCDEELKVPVTLIRYRTYKWLQDVTREG